MQGHSESAKAKIKCWINLTTKQATSINTTVGHFLRDLDWECLYGLTHFFLFQEALEESDDSDEEDL